MAPAEARAERAVDVRREAEVRRVAVQVRQRARVFKRRAAKLQLRQTPGDHRVVDAREGARSDARRSGRDGPPAVCQTVPLDLAPSSGRGSPWRIGARPPAPAQGGTDDHLGRIRRVRRRRRSVVRRPKPLGFRRPGRRGRSSAGGRHVLLVVVPRSRARTCSATPRGRAPGSAESPLGDARAPVRRDARGSCASTSCARGASSRRGRALRVVDAQASLARRMSACRACPAAGRRRPPT